MTFSIILEHENEVLRELNNFKALIEKLHSVTYLDRQYDLSSKYDFKFISGRHIHPMEFDCDFITLTDIDITEDLVFVSFDYTIEVGGRGGYPSETEYHQCKYSFPISYLQAEDYTKETDKYVQRLVEYKNELKEKEELEKKKQLEEHLKQNAIRRAQKEKEHQEYLAKKAIQDVIDEKNKLKELALKYPEVLKELN